MRRFRPAIGCVALVAALATLFPGCSEPKSSPSLNSNTSWLKTCDEPAECDSGLSCTCGVCTTLCSTSTDCNSLDAVCVQQSSLSHQALCGGTTSQAICLPDCSTHADCDDGLSCVADRCAPPLSADPCAGLQDALFCSGFEDLDNVEAAALIGEGKVELSEAAPYAGTSSLLSTTELKEDRARVAFEYPNAAGTTLHLRVWLAISPGTPLSDLNLITLGDRGTADWGVNFGVHAGTLRAERAGFPSEGGLVDVPLGTWFCLRATVHFDHAIGSVQAWLNDEITVDVANVDTLPAAGVYNIYMGIDWSGQDGTSAVFLDNLVLSESPVGCSAVL